MPALTCPICAGSVWGIEAVAGGVRIACATCKEDARAGGDVRPQGVSAGVDAQAPGGGEVRRGRRGPMKGHGGRPRKTGAVSRWTERRRAKEDKQKG